MTTRTYLAGSAASDDFVFDTDAPKDAGGTFVLPEPDDEVIVLMTGQDGLRFDSADPGDGAVQDDGPTCDPSANPVLIVVADNHDFYFNE